MHIQHHKTKVEAIPTDSLNPKAILTHAIFHSKKSIAMLILFVVLLTGAVIFGGKHEFNNVTTHCKRK